MPVYNSEFNIVKALGESCREISLTPLVACSYSLALLHDLHLPLPPALLALAALEHVDVGQRHAVQVLRGLQHPVWDITSYQTCKPCLTMLGMESTWSAYLSFVLHF